MVQQITAHDVAAPGGHYSHAVRDGDTIYISGQLPVAPDGTHRADADFARQARLALANLLAVAKAAGADRDGLVKVTAYIVDVADWPIFNIVYAEMMGDARPARSVVTVPALHHGYLIEVEAIAAMPGGGSRI